MKEIKKLVHQIEDEIHDAEKYAKCAIETKDTRPELARIYVQLAGQEMEHMSALHGAVTNLIEEERRNNGEPPAGMLQAYDIIHEWQVAHAAEVRSLIQLARE